MEERYANAKKLADFLESHGVNYEFVLVDNHAELAKTFERGAVDVIPDSSISSIKCSKQLASYTTEFFYFGSTKGNTELVAELDAAIDRLNLAFPYFQVNLTEKYSNNTQGAFFITDEESAYTKEKKIIRALCVPDCAPFIF